jgi:hypothetical protein
VIDPRANMLFDAVRDDVPGDWDMLYLGGHHRLKQGEALRPVQPALPVIDVSNRKQPIMGLYRITGTLCAHAYGVAGRMYGPILEALAPPSIDAAVDRILARFHAQTRSFVVRPHIAWQDGGYSIREQKWLPSYVDLTRFG